MLWMTWFSRILCGLRIPPLACLLPALVIVALCSRPAAWSQEAKLSPGQQPDAKVTLGGRVTSKGQPLAKATVTVINTISGARLTALTDPSGAWSLLALRRGVYLVRVEKPGYAPLARQQSVITADEGFDCDLLPQGEEESRGIGSRALASLWPSVQIPPPASSSLNFNLSIQQQTATAVSHASVSIPSFAGDPYFSDDSFSIEGQSDPTNPYLLGGSLMENDFENGPETQNPEDYAAQFSNMFGSGPGGGGFDALLKAAPDRPHGFLFWNGGNSVLNARPFVLAGQPNPNPDYSSNNYGGVWSGHPMLPGRQSKRDFVLVTYSGVTARSLVNSYGLVPTDLERQGNFSQLLGPTGEPVPIYPPQETNIPYPNNTINTALDPVALAILSFLPEPNLTGSTLNYHLLTTQGTHLNAIGARYNHSFGAAPAAVPGLMHNTGGLTQSFALNFNYSHQATDVVDLFPRLGGKQFNESYALTATHTIAKGNWIANLAVTSIRSNLQVRNFFTGADDVATRLGLQGFGVNAPVNANPFNYGLPNLIFSGFSGFSQTQPASILNQSFGISGNSAWLYGKHLIRTGVDARRIDLNLFGGTDVTGTQIFTGRFTQKGGLFSTNPVSVSGSSFADFLLGIPQEVMIESPNQKAYMRQNDWQVFVRDDWRLTPLFTLLVGVRYNYFSPYAEKYDRLSTLDYVPGGGVPLPVQPNGIGPVSGAKYPRTLIYPERNNFSPHLGFAWQGSPSTVVRAAYSIHYTVGQYGSFMQSLAYQPPFANTLTIGNTLLEFQNDDHPPFYFPLLNLENAFNVQAGDGNYAINRHYRIPYIQFWTAGVEQALPLQIVIDASYTGAKGTRLDTITAPGLFNESSIASLFFDYQDSTAFSNFNALTVTATKRLQSGLALSATYIYSHAIDNAASINAGSPIVAQNPDNILAEEGNSNFDIRHQVYGSLFYELPFGPNMPFLNSSHWKSRIFGDWALAGTFAATSGLPLTPYIAASAVEVARGTHGSVRPDRNFGVPLMAGGGHLTHWFNTKAFSTQFAPGQLYGTASRNSIPGPGVLNMSASLSKTFLMGEGNSLELRCTAANVWNAVQYSAVNTQFDSPTVGQVTATQPMRQLTFLGRFRF